MEWFFSLLYSQSSWVYVSIFLIGIPEGPMLTVTCGSFAIEGLLNPLLVYCAVVFGDMVGDTRHYLEGRLLSWAGRASSKYRLATWLNRRFKVDERMEKARSHIEQSPLVAFCCFKLAYGPGALGLITAGATRFPYLRFVRNCAAVSLCQALVYLSLGMILGEGVSWLRDHVNQYVLFVCFGCVMIGLVLAVRWISSRLLPKAPHHTPGSVV